MKMIEQMNKEHYLESGGNRCPYCGSESITASHYELENDFEIKQEVICNDCDKRWKDVLRLVDIEEME